MKIKVNEASVIQLDWMVAKCEGWDYDDPQTPLHKCRIWKPTTNWAQGGPIIEKAKIRLDCAWNPGPWNGACKIDGVTAWTEGPTPLIAAMRCFVASKLGDEVEMPDELC